MNNREKIFNNISWLFFDKVLRIFGGLVIGVWVARYLGPEKYGILNYSLAFIAFFSFFSDLGLNTIVIRELTKKSILQEKLLGTAFALKLIGAFFAIFFSIVTINIVKNNDFNVKVMVSLASLCYIFQSFDVIDYLFQSEVMSKNVVIARNGGFLFASLAKILLIVFRMNVFYFAIAFIIETLISALLMISIYLKKKSSIRLWKYDKIVAMNLLGYSWPLMVSLFLITIYIRIDQIMIESFLDMSQVGLYSVAVRLCTSWYFVPSIIISSFMPYFLKIKEQNYQLFKYRLRQINSLMIWVGIAAGICSLLFGKQIIVMLFGYEYVDSFGALSFNIWAGIFISLGYASNLWVISENLQIYRLIGTSISVVVNIIGNYFLIPVHGIAGAALATLITQIVATWITPLFFKDIRYFTVLSIKSIVPIFGEMNKK